MSPHDPWHERREKLVKPAEIFGGNGGQGMVPDARIVESFTTTTSQAADA